MRLTLWDEAERKLVRFRDLRAAVRRQLSESVRRLKMASKPASLLA